MRVRDDVGRHEADVVPVQRIFAARISKAHPQLHRRSLAGASTNKNRPPHGRRAVLVFREERKAYSSEPPSSPPSASPSSASSPTVGTSPSAVAAASSSSDFIADGA